MKKLPNRLFSTVMVVIMLLTVAFADWHVKAQAAGDPLTPPEVMNSGTYGDDHMFTWALTFMPGTDAGYYPVTIVDTFNNTLHRWNAGYSEIGIASSPDNAAKGIGTPLSPSAYEIVTIGVTTTISYDVDSLPGDNIYLYFTTRLTDAAYAGADYGETTTVSNSVILESDVSYPFTPVIAYADAAPEEKNFITKTVDKEKTETGWDGFLNWTTTITDIDRGLSSLVLHDEYSDGMDMILGSISVKDQHGNPLPYTYDGSRTFCTDPTHTGPNGFDLILTPIPAGVTAYKITYQTMVKDEYIVNGFLETPDPGVDGSYHNDAWITFEWMPGGTGSVIPVRAPAAVADIEPNTRLIENDATAYNPANHSITYQFIVNPSGLILKEGVASDPLPVNSVPPGLTEQGTSYTPGTFSWKFLDDSSVTGYEGRVGFTPPVDLKTLEFYINNDGYSDSILKKPIVITFRAAVDDPHIFGENLSAFTDSSDVLLYPTGEKQFTNEASIDGTIILDPSGVRTEVPVKDHDEAVIPVTSSVINKDAYPTGNMYKFGANTITWMITVNENKMMMPSNTQLVDNLAFYLEYIPGSAKYATSADPAGAVFYSPSDVDYEQSDTTNALTINMGSFSNTRYVFFDTAVIEDNMIDAEPALSAIENTAVLTRAGSGFNEVSAYCSVDIEPVVIDLSAITGLTAPVRGAVPVTAITETDQYTGVVTWTPVVSGTFAAKTDYTATIKLTAKANYTLTGVAANFFTVEGATAANAADSGVITAEFPKTDADPSSGGSNGGSGATHTVTFDLSAWTNPFTDVKSTEWFYGDVEYVCKNGLMTGVSTDMFAPGATVTRGMVVTVLYRLAGEPDPQGGGIFTDVAKDKYYAYAAAWASANKIVQGYGDGRFGPEDYVTREQMAAIILRYLNFIEADYVITDDYRFFEDENEISGYAKNAVQVLNKLGIINGKGNDIIDPKGNAIRAELAAMLSRLSELVK